VVEQVHDLDLNTPIVFTAGGGSDTGWRQVFPFTYDIPVDHPEAVQSASANGPPEEPEAGQ
jgi:hypothetical protein